MSWTDAVGVIGVAMTPGRLRRRGPGPVGRQGRAVAVRQLRRRVPYPVVASGRLQSVCPPDGGQLGVGVAAGLVRLLVIRLRRAAPH